MVYRSDRLVWAAVLFRTTRPEVVEGAILRRSERLHWSRAMREWLDRNQYEPARFDCDQNGDEVVLSVDFRVDTAAEAFGRRFGGEDPLRGLPPLS